VKNFAAVFLDHLQREEDNLHSIGKKYIPLTQQLEIIKKIWNFTPVERWRRLIPFTINNQHIHERRIRFLKVFRWAVPEHMQLIGHILYENTTPVMWERLIADVPELIPRHLPYWRPNLV